MSRPAGRRQLRALDMQKNEEVTNYLKVINFDYPEWMPAVFGLVPATWLKYGDLLEEIILSHPILFPHYEKDDFRKLKLTRGYQEGRWTDVWGVVWDNTREGMDSSPVETLAPLLTWDAMAEYEVPDSLKFYRYGDAIDWEERRETLEEVKALGGLANGKIYHGAMYMRLYYLRGFQNLMMDIATRDPRLDTLIDIVLEYNLKLIDKWIEIGVEAFGFGDDLGLQKNLPMSPTDWRHYLKPCFAQMFGACRKSGVLVAFHSDGYILDIIPDLIECGADILNPQVGPNTLEGLREHCRGKIAIKLDLDRQLFPFATEHQLRDHIEEAIDTLALPEGGLMLYAEFNPDVPLDNIEAICATLERLGCRGM